MTVYLCQQSYGKSRVRFTKVQRNKDSHDLVEMSVEVELDGEFDAAYVESDNSLLIPTDTIKNAILAFARELDPFSQETFSWLLGAHFVENYPHVSTAIVRSSSTPWQRATVNGTPHPHAFVGGSSERWTCEAMLVQGEDPEEADGEIRCGIEGITLIKTTGSGFAGFLKDELTTLEESEELMLASTISANWAYNDAPKNWHALRMRIRETLIEKFVSGFSPSVQATLYAMAEAVLELDPIIEEVAIHLPYQHYELANLEPFGLENPHLLFVPHAEPLGNVRAVASRTPPHVHTSECNH